MSNHNNTGVPTIGVDRTIDSIIGQSKTNGIGFNNIAGKLLRLDPASKQAANALAELNTTAANLIGDITTVLNFFNERES